MDLADGHVAALQKILKTEFSGISLIYIMVKTYSMNVESIIK